MSKFSPNITIVEIHPNNHVTIIRLRKSGKLIDTFNSIAAALEYMKIRQAIRLNKNPTNNKPENKNLDKSYKLPLPVILTRNPKIKYKLPKIRKIIYSDKKSVFV